MQKKLTLRVNSDGVARAKKVARQRRQSVSNIVEEHLQKLAPRNGSKLPKQPVPDWILEMWKSNEEWKKKQAKKNRNAGKTDDELKYEYVSEKYLKD